MEKITVRVGVLVAYADSKYSPFEHWMFYCKSKNPKIRRLAEREVALLDTRHVVRPKGMRHYELRRYWVHMSFNGEVRPDLAETTIHSMKRCK